MNKSKGLDREIRTRLEPGESSRLVASLRIPKQFTSATSWIAIIVFVRLFDEIRNLFQMRTFRHQFEAIQLPIARKMTVCITERRILLWKQSTLRPRHSFLGSVDRSRVVSSQVAPSTR